MRVIHKHDGNDWAAEVDDANSVSIAVKASSREDHPASWVVMCNAVWHAKHGIVTSLDRDEPCSPVAGFIVDALTALIREAKGPEPKGPERWVVVRGEHGDTCVAIEGAGVEWHSFIGDFIDSKGGIVCHLTAYNCDKAALIAAAPELMEALSNLLARDQRNTCQHIHTRRDSGTWQHCDECGAMWADDEGGKPAWEDPPEWVKASAIIEKLKKGQA